MLLIVILLALIENINAFSTGAPICNIADTEWKSPTNDSTYALKFGGLKGGLTPMGQPDDPGPAGFRLFASTTKIYQPGDLITLRVLHSNDTTQLKGLLLYADWTGFRVNGFEVPDTRYKHVKCGAKSTTGTVTHSDARLKYPPTFKYRVQDTPGIVRFSAVVVGDQGKDDWHILEPIEVKIKKEVVRPPRNIYSFSVPDSEGGLDKRPFDAGTCPPVTGKTRLSTLDSYQEGGNIYVPKDKTYVIRTDTPELHSIAIAGTLVFDRTTEQTVLTVKSRLIDILPTGRMIVGTPQCTWPEDKIVEFEMIGQPPELVGDKEEPEVIERQLIRLHQGAELIMHGSHVGPTWTKLFRSMDVGDSRVRTAEPVNFRAGENILLTSTDYDFALDDSGKESFCEVRPILQRFDPHTFELARGVTHRHHGKQWCVDNMEIKDRTTSARCADGRGEVASLSRNIIIHGRLNAFKETLEEQEFGARILVDGEATIQMDGVEIYHAGHRNREYGAAVLFKHGFNMTGSFLKRCSIHETFNRGIDIRVTRGLLFAENIVYNTVGHNIAMVTGGEYDNRFYRNLVAHPQSGSPLFHDFPGTAGFFVTSAQNDFVGNVAVGGDHGYWYMLDMWVRDNEFRRVDPQWVGVVPERGRPGMFANNIAHSQRKTGLNIYNRIVAETKAGIPSKYSGAVTFVPQDAHADFIWSANLTSQLDAVPKDYKYSSSNEYYKKAKSLVEKGRDMNFMNVNFTAFKVSERAVLTYMYYGVFQRPTILDCPVGIQLQGYGNFINDGLFVAETDNFGNTQIETFVEKTQHGRTRPKNVYVGEQMALQMGSQQLGPIFVSNSHFYGWSKEERERKELEAGKTVTEIDVLRRGVYGQLGSDYAWQAHTFFSRVRLYKSQVYTVPAPSIRGSTTNPMAFDTDGSLTGVCGGTVTPDVKGAFHPGCSLQDGYRVCPETFGFGTVRWVSFYDDENRITRSVKADANTIVHRLSASASERSSITMMPAYSHYDGTARKSYYEHRVKANLFTGLSYLLEFPNGRTSQAFRTYIYHAAKNEFVNLAIPFPTNTTFTITRRIAYSSFVPAKQAASKNQLNITHSWYFDKAQRLLWIHQADNRGNIGTWPRLPFQTYYQSGTYHTIRAKCPGGKCTIKAPSAASVQPPKLTAKNPDSYICETRGGPLKMSRWLYSEVEGSKRVIFDNALAPNITHNAGLNVTTDVTYEDSTASLWANFTIRGYPNLYVSKTKLWGLKLTPEKSYFVFRMKGLVDWRANVTAYRPYNIMQVYFRRSNTDLCASQRVTVSEHGVGEPDKGWQQFAIPMTRCPGDLASLDRILIYNSAGFNQGDAYFADMYFVDYDKQPLLKPYDSWLPRSDWKTGWFEEERIQNEFPADVLAAPPVIVVPQPPKDDYLIRRGARWSYASLNATGLSDDEFLQFTFDEYAMDTNVWKEGPAPLGIETVYDEFSPIKTYLDLGGLLGERVPFMPTTAPPTTANNRTTMAPTTPAPTTIDVNATTAAYVEPLNITARILFRHKFRVEPASSQADLYRLRVASNDYAHVFINGELVDKDVDVHPYAYWNREVEVDAAIFKPFENLIAVVLHNEYENPGETVFFDLELVAMGVPDMYVKPPDAAPGQRCPRGTPGCACFKDKTCHEHLLCQSGDVCAGHVCRNGAPGCLCRTDEEAAQEKGFLCSSGLVCYLGLCLRDSTCGPGLDEGCVCKSGKCSGAGLECRDGYCERACSPGLAYCPCAANGECEDDDFACADVDGEPRCVLELTADDSIDASHVSLSALTFATLLMIAVLF